jgi:hypothetical protein
MILRIIRGKASRLCLSPINGASMTDMVDFF